MEEIQNKNAHKTSDATNAKKRKGFWSNLFGRSSHANEKTEEQDSNHKGGLMNSFANSARQAAVREVESVAKDEAMHEVEALVNKNNNGSQSSDPSANVAPDSTTTTTPSDVVNATTSWAKRMADTARERVQGLQTSLGS